VISSAGFISREDEEARREIDFRDDAPTLLPKYLGGVSLRIWTQRWGDWALALALAAGAEYELWAHAPAGLDVIGGRASLAAALAAATVPLAWRQRAPVTVLFLITGAVAAVAFLVREPGGIPLGVFLALIIAFYSVGAHCHERRALFVGAGALATLAALDLARGAFQAHGHARPAAWFVFSVAWLVGREVRRRRGELTLLRERAAQLEREREERARTAVAEERGRIARELHDVVAHSVSVMVVQAQAGPRLLDDAEQARGVFRSIEASGREALVELRRLLGILRRGDQQLSIGPQPGLGSLRSLLEQVREAGLPVELRIEGEQAPLPPGIDLAAYRIVQEALTNTLKHAGQARASIVVRYAPAALELEISDNGAGTAAAVNGSGHGLIGMRERATLYGGSLEAGARDNGGYAVRARLPLGGGTRR
jgi:signal transduction histidine kinase